MDWSGLPSGSLCHHLCPHRTAITLLFRDLADLRHFQLQPTCDLDPNSRHDHRMHRALHLHLPFLFRYETRLLRSLHLDRLHVHDQILYERGTGTDIEPLQSV